MNRSFSVQGAFAVVRCQLLKCEGVKVEIKSFWRWLCRFTLFFEVEKLSFGGLVIKSPKHLKKGKKLKVVLYLPRDRDGFVLLGTVVKCTSDFAYVRFALFGKKGWINGFNSMEALGQLKELPSLRHSH